MKRQIAKVVGDPGGDAIGSFEQDAVEDGPEEERDRAEEEDAGGTPQGRMSDSLADTACEDDAIGPDRSPNVRRRQEADRRARSHSCKSDRQRREPEPRGGGRANQRQQSEPGTGAGAESPTK